MIVDVSFGAPYIQWNETRFIKVWATCSYNRDASSSIKEQQTSFTSAYLDKVRQSWHTALPPPWCALFTPSFWVRAWPWQRATLASFPRSLPFLGPHVMRGGGGPRYSGCCWCLSLKESLPAGCSGLISLKTQHQKWDTWKWVTQRSPELRHFS